MSGRDRVESVAAFGWNHRPESMEYVVTSTRGLSIMNDHVRLKDIAEEAGVSITTVSLALRGRTNRVNEDTRKKIIKIAQSLNYIPNMIARSLVSKQSNTIGIVIKNLFSPFHAEFAQTIINCLEETGYSALLSTSGNNPEDVNVAVKNIISRNVAGVIVSNSVYGDDSVSELEKRNIPYVLALRDTREKPSEQKYDFVGIDDTRGAYMIVEHLIKLGHKRIFILAGPQNCSPAKNRLKGAKLALSDYNINPDNALISIEKDFKFQSCYETISKYLRKKITFTAICAQSDQMALGVISALSAIGLKTPHDIAVTGFDDINASSLPGLMLTTVSQERPQICSIAVNNLLEKISNPETYINKRVNPKLSTDSGCFYSAKGS